MAGTGGHCAAGRGGRATVPHQTGGRYPRGLPGGWRTGHHRDGLVPDCGQCKQQLGFLPQRPVYLRGLRLRRGGPPAGGGGRDPVRHLPPHHQGPARAVLHPLLLLHRLQHPGLCQRRGGRRLRHRGGQRRGERTPDRLYDHPPLLRRDRGDRGHLPVFQLRPP